MSACNCASLFPVGDRWVRVVQFLNADTRRVRFEASKGRGAAGDIALDDILIVDRAAVGKYRGTHAFKRNTLKLRNRIC